MRTFQDFLQSQNEGLQTTLGQRSPGGVGQAAGKYVAADFIPGAGLLKATGEFLWNIISNRRQRLNFQELNQRASQHKQALAQAGIDPNTVFRLDDRLARMLSDEAIYKIMEETLQKLDYAAQNGYRGLPRQGNLVELVALNTIKPWVQSLMGIAHKAIPVAKPAK